MNNNITQKGKYEHGIKLIDSIDMLILKVLQEQYRQRTTPFTVERLYEYINISGVNGRQHLNRLKGIGFIERKPSPKKEQGRIEKVIITKLGLKFYHGWKKVFFNYTLSKMANYKTLLAASSFKRLREELRNERKA